MLGLWTSLALTFLVTNVVKLMIGCGGCCCRICSSRACEPASSCAVGCQISRNLSLPRRRPRPNFAVRCWPDGKVVWSPSHEFSCLCSTRLSCLRTSLCVHRSSPPSTRLASRVSPSAQETPMLRWRVARASRVATRACRSRAWASSPSISSRASGPGEVVRAAFRCPPPMSVACPVHVRVAYLPMIRCLDLISCESVHLFAAVGGLCDVAVRTPRLCLRRAVPCPLAPFRQHRPAASRRVGGAHPHPRLLAPPHGRDGWHSAGPDNLLGGESHENLESSP